MTLSHSRRQGCVSVDENRQRTEAALTPFTPSCAAAATAIGAALVLAFAPTPRSAASDEVQLRSQEITALLSGEVRLRSLPIADTGPAERLEFFHANGRYEGCADRAIRSGTFEIEGDRLCTTSAHNTQCRLLFRTSSGYSERLIDASGIPDRGRGVEVVPAPKGQSCHSQEAPR